MFPIESSDVVDSIDFSPKYFLDKAKLFSYNYLASSNILSSK